MKNSQKGFIIPLIISIIAVLAIGGVVFVTQKKEVKAPIIINPISTTTNPIIGGDSDIHGCKASAGYSWCAVKNKCLRVWEEKCEVIATTTNSVISTIKLKLIGVELKYYDLGRGELIYKIKEENILNIETVPCGHVDYKLVDDSCYRVSIGNPRPDRSAMWYIYIDKDTLEQVKKEQLFRT